MSHQQKRTTNLFFGLGKVNLALAKVSEGEKLAFVEEKSQVIFSRFHGSEWREEKRISGKFEDIDFSEYLERESVQIFLSPGIDPRRKFFSPQLQKKEVRELDYFCERFQSKEIIAITGTDGKSTFTTQLHAVLKRLFPQKKIFLGGNIGVAMAEGLLEPYDMAVLEISSFQAERLQSAQLSSAILLNLDLDHQDRYHSFEDYARAKWELLLKAEDVAYPKGLTVPAFMSQKVSQIGFSNHENLRTILTLYARFLAKKFGAEWKDHVLKDLPTLRHRLEIYRDQEGALFVNDSKATTVHAVLYAVETLRKYSENIRLILGGRFKGDDFSRLIPQLKLKDEILVVGEAAETILAQLETWGGSKTIYRSLKNLLETELKTPSKNLCLVLSPGCSSYDEFKNFEERGDFFLSQVQKTRSLTRLDELDLHFRLSD